MPGYVEIHSELTNSSKCSPRRSGKVPLWEMRTSAVSYDHRHAHAIMRRRERAGHQQGSAKLEPVAARSVELTRGTGAGAAGRAHLDGLDPQYWRGGGTLRCQAGRRRLP